MADQKADKPIKTKVDLSEDFMVNCMVGGGKLNIGEAGLSCTLPNGEITKPTTPPSTGPKR